MFYDIMQITIISIAALIAIIYLSICQKQHAELYNKVFEAGFTHDISAESVEKYRRNYVLFKTLYLIFDYPYKYYTFKHFEV